MERIAADWQAFLIIISAHELPVTMKPMVWRRPLAMDIAKFHGLARKALALHEMGVYTGADAAQDTRNDLDW